MLENPISKVGRLCFECQPPSDQVPRFPTSAGRAQVFRSYCVISELWSQAERIYRLSSRLVARMAWDSKPPRPLASHFIYSAHVRRVPRCAGEHGSCPLAALTRHPSLFDLLSLAIAPLCIVLGLWLVSGRFNTKLAIPIVLFGFGDSYIARDIASLADQRTHFRMVFRPLSRLLGSGSSRGPGFGTA